ncbi:hypothetical protein KC799_07250, partial [candidate division KSB1 bacterium]|nr:hypothetical protein [candidate division KSB1 bacterium]
LYNRLKINVELCENLNIYIYSFPMKYIPLYGEESKNREFIGKKWNRKFIRAIQSILNVTRGIVSPGRNFFEKAFGKNISEYHELLYMPETYIVYRKIFEEELGYTKIWREQFNNLSKDDWIEAKPIIESNEFQDYTSKTNNPKVLKLLKHYSVKNYDVKKDDIAFKKLRRKYDRLIKGDQFLNLTITYDFENVNKSNGIDTFRIHVEEKK